MSARALPPSPLEEAVKLDKRACSFEATSGPTDVDGDRQVMTGNLNCPASESGTGCSISRTESVSVSQTNTFGASAEVGASFFEVVQVSVSFSYEYSYTEERSQSVQNTVNLNPGQSGYLTWVPLLECKLPFTIPLIPRACTLTIPYRHLGTVFRRFL
jgi:hypothetical protein